jgi:Bacterial cadherin-like domain/RTX calcium-binding nonapeptide repeat (4 copies)
LLHEEEIFGRAQRAGARRLCIAVAIVLIPAAGVAVAATSDSAPAPRAAACGGLTPTIKGSKGDDRGVDKIKGTAGDDVISARAGNDVVTARAGDDALCGGPGKDKLKGGPGADTCDGGPGKDKLKGCESPGQPPPVNEAPVADDDSFSGTDAAVANTALVTNAPGDGPPALSGPKKSISGNILAGDTDPDGDSLAVQPVSNQATNDGGVVTIEADGDFTFLPAASTSCSDHSDFFDYTVSDQNTTPGTDTGRVTIAIAGCVWYVSNNAAGNSGTSVAPFDTLAQAEAASSANDSVFVFDGDNTSTGYGGDRYAMNAGERLIGEHEGFAVDPDGGGPLGTATLLPANPGAHPTLTATNADVIDLDDGNEVRGIQIDPQGTGGGIAASSGDSGGTIDDVSIADTGTPGTQPGLELDSTTGTFGISNLVIDSTVADGLRATNSGTITVQGSGNTIDTTTGTALSVANTTIGAGGLTFRRISSNGATNGIVLSNTGANAGLTVTGNGNTSVGGDNSGGTIQNTTSFGISLVNTASPSFTNVRLQDTSDSAINGTQVSGFSFTNGTITGAGDAADENSISFDDSVTNANITGALTISNNVITRTETSGVDIQNASGTISDANISGNTISDTGDAATPGAAVSLVALGSASAAASIAKAALSDNTITDFHAGYGFLVQGGNTTVGGPPGNIGIAGSATNVIAITGNSMNGGTGGIGNQPLRFVTASAAGNGQGNFDVSGNGTAGNRIRNIDCIAIELQADGPVNMTSNVQDNFINANNTLGCAGIAVGTDDIFALGAGTHTATVSGNNVMGTDGPGIFPIIRNSGSTMTVKVLSNTVAAPTTTTAARAGIRVDSGSAAGDTTLCLEISGNSTAGSTNTGTGTTSPGINLRKQGTSTTVNSFSIEGLSPSPTGTPTVENFVNSINTSSSGTFGVGGTALLSATSGFTSCTAP